MRSSVKPFLFCLTALVCALPAFAQEITVTPAKAGGVYAVGEKVVWRVGVTGEGSAGIDKIRYVVKSGGLTEIKSGEIILKDGSAELEASLNAPGSLLAEFTTNPSGKKPITNLAGAVVAPEKIKPSAPRPADFDAFWAAKIKELKSVPMNPVLETGESGIPNVEYAKITLDNIRGTKIQGQLAKPKTGAKFPALLIVQWAGIYPLQKGWVTPHAKDGWLTLNINAHDLPIDAPADFYKAQEAKELANYPAIGNEDKETSYFLRMYLSCYRAADYLASRPDWDGRNLVVLGTSQGGLQSMMLGGLHPKISTVIANVPAGCDQTGPQVGRQPGWPMWAYQASGKDKAKVMETSRYYDVVNFASRIKCPALVATGLIDTTCPCAGVIAAFNQIRSPKELILMERSSHGDVNNSQAAFYARSYQWLTNIKAGKPPKSTP